MTQPPWSPQRPVGPTQPVGQQPAPVSIEQFQAPRNRTGLILALVAAAAIAALAVLAVLRFAPTSPATTGGSAAPSPAASSATRSASPRGSAWISEPRDAAGYWEILEEKWSGNKVTLRIRVECDKGSTPLVFFVISNTTVSDQWEADTTGVPSPNLHGGRVSAGEKLEGYVQITMPRGQATLIMASSARNPISGLIING